MRPIKFRAWDGRKMWAGEDFQMIALNAGDGGIVGYSNVHCAIAENAGDLELMQYTGLKDKNGKEIYEGDFIRFYVSTHEYNMKKYGMHPNRWLFICKYENACFGYIGASKWLQHADDMIFKPFYDYEENELRDTSNVEIIGNMCETPELFNNRCAVKR